MCHFMQLNGGHTQGGEWSEIMHSERSKFVASNCNALFQSHSRGQAKILKKMYKNHQAIFRNSKFYKKYYKELTRIIKNSLSTTYARPSRLSIMSQRNYLKDVGFAPSTSFK